MISRGRKSDEKCYVEELARFTVVIKEVCLVNGIQMNNLLLFDTRSYPVKLCLAFIDHSSVTGFCHLQFIISSHTVQENCLERQSK